MKRTNSEFRVLGSEFRSHPGILVWFHSELTTLNFDNPVKSRHPGENRGPEVCKYPEILDSGFRRNDEKERFPTFYERINLINRIFHRAKVLQLFESVGGLGT